MKPYIDLKRTLKKPYILYKPYRVGHMINFWAALPAWGY